MTLGIGLLIQLDGRRIKKCRLGRLPSWPVQRATAKTKQKWLRGLCSLGHTLHRRHSVKLIRLTLNLIRTPRQVRKVKDGRLASEEAPEQIVAADKMPETFVQRRQRAKCTVLFFTLIQMDRGALAYVSSNDVFPFNSFSF